LASSLMNSIQTVSGNQPAIRRIIEKNGQTFLAGTPVMIDSGSGGIKAWDGTTIPQGIAGITKEFGANLATTGVPQQQSFGSVPNESAARNYSRPYFNDGKNGFEVANEDTIFEGQVGPAQTALVTDVGVEYGMTIDSDGHWYIDKTKTTVGTNTVAVIVKLDPDDQSATPRGVYFKIIKAAQQLSQ
jgi:hypothetical protein